MSEVTIIEADVEQSRDNPDYESLPTHSLYVHLIAGAAAGTMEHCVMYPIDSVKTRVQSLCPCPEKGGRTPVHSLLTLVRREGVWRPMRGVNAIAFGAAPAHALYFSVYERLKTRLTGNTRGHHNTWAYGVSGAAATLVHDAVMNPAEVVKQRMQMCSSPYNGSVECAKCVFRSEGWCAFYRSYTTQLLLNVPFQTVHFMTYEFVQQVSNPSHHYDPKSHVLAGALAGGLAAAVTNPLDVIKTVLNTQQRPAPLVAPPPEKSILAGRSGTPVLTWARWRRLLAAEQQLHKPGGRATPRLDGKHCPASYRGIRAAALGVWRDRGFRGFFAGFQARILTQAPATAISWSVYELFKYLLAFTESDRLHR